MRKVIGNVLLSISVLAALSAAWLWALFLAPNPVSRANAALREARKAFNQGEYTVAFAQLKLAQDSLKQNQEAIQLNIAHTAFHVRKAASANAPGDSIIAAHTQYYQQLLGAADTVIASIAYNQSGVLAADVPMGGQENADAPLQEAVSYFRSAIRADNRNDAARFNYELVQKKLQYPEILMAAVKELVKARRYRDAHIKLKSAASRDPRIAKNYEDYLKRLEDIIKIDQ